MFDNEASALRLFVARGPDSSVKVFLDNFIYKINNLKKDDYAQRTRILEIIEENIKLATRNGNAETIKLFLSYPEIRRNGMVDLALLEAVAVSNHEAIKLLLPYCSSTAKGKGLHDATFTGRVEIANIFFADESIHEFVHYDNNLTLKHVCKRSVCVSAEELPDYEEIITLLLKFPSVEFLHLVDGRDIKKIDEFLNKIIAASVSTIPLIERLQISLTGKINNVMQLVNDHISNGIIGQALMNAVENRDNKMAWRLLTYFSSHINSYYLYHAVDNAIKNRDLTTLKTLLAFNGVIKAIEPFFGLIVETLYYNIDLDSYQNSAASFGILKELKKFPGFTLVAAVVNNDIASIKKILNNPSDISEIGMGVGLIQAASLGKVEAISKLLHAGSKQISHTQKHIALICSVEGLHYSATNALLDDESIVAIANKDNNSVLKKALLNPPEDMEPTFPYVKALAKLISIPSVVEIAVTDEATMQSISQIYAPLRGEFLNNQQSPALTTGVKTGSESITPFEGGHAVRHGGLSPSGGCMIGLVHFI